MSRRADLLRQLMASDKYGQEKEQEQRFLEATSELILSDLIDIAINGVAKHGAGTLVLNLQNDSTTYMSGHAVEFDIRTAEREEDEEVLTMLRSLMEKIDTNDWTKNVLITLISEHGTRTFALEAGVSQQNLKAFAEELRG